MKKTVLIIIILSLLILLCACDEDAQKLELPTQPQQAAATPASEPAPTPKPTPTPTPEPEWTPATVKANDVGILWAKLLRGDEITVSAENDEWCFGSFEGTNVFIEKRFLRASSEAAPEMQTYYAAGSGGIYPDPYFEGESLATPARNDELELLDIFGGICLVKYNDIIGFMREEDVSPTLLQNYYYGGGGGGSSGGADGGDIQLSWRVTAYKAMQLAVTEEMLMPVQEYKATVLADGTEAYLAIVDRGTELRVTDVKDGVSEIYLESGLFGTVDDKVLKHLGADDYEEWTAYSDRGATAYTDYLLRNTPELLEMNTEMTVIDEMDGILIAEIYGQIYYIHPENVSPEKYVTHYYSGGGSGGSGGGEWTAPVL